MVDVGLCLQIKIADHLLWQPNDGNGPGSKLMREAGEVASLGQR